MKLNEQADLIWGERVVNERWSPHDAAAHAFSEEKTVNIRLKTLHQCEGGHASESSRGPLMQGVFLCLSETRSCALELKPLAVVFLQQIIST